MQTYTILGRVPSKKNSRILTIRGGRPISFPGKNYAQWHKDALKQLVQKKSAPVPCKIEITIYHDTLRSGDLTNKAESVMDLLVDAGVLADDNWFHVSGVTLLFGGVSPEPRAEVIIQ